MPELVADCPRCDSKKHTFTVKTFHFIRIAAGWQNHYESYCVCRHCSRGTIFRLSQLPSHRQSKFFSSEENLMQHRASINQIMNIEGFVNIRNQAKKPPPEHIPENIQKVYLEGSESFSGGCPNAAAAMFRLCVDLATKNLLPSTETSVEGLNQKVRNNLSERLKWLFEKNILPNSLESLSECIRQDGNDGAHDGTITHTESEDLLEFTYLLLERIYTEPAKLELAKKRREDRRNTAKEA